MDTRHQIPIKNVCFIKVAYRKIGSYYSDGIVVFDIDSYCFAGNLTGDTFVGIYDPQKGYTFYYTREKVKKDYEGYYIEEERSQIEAKIIISDFTKELIGNKYAVYDGEEIEIEFVKILNRLTPSRMQSILEENQELFILKEE